ncbi:type II secretion system protein GspG, partial [Pseudomonas aeruginosa]|uniref:type II secretion system protein GspG n=1 Tax=Pseudomonas aeruginosa TaxID=287 RepID=UPI0020D04CF7
YMQEKLRIRKELREVQYQLNADIDALGRTLKLVNIALVPSLLAERPADASASNWRSYLERLPNDPWGKPYQYLNPGVNGEIDV